MRFKKYLLFICAIIILLMAISLPYLLLSMKDYSLLNQNVIQNVESNENDSRNLTTLQKIKLISYFMNFTSKKYLSDSQPLSFSRELDNNEIDLLYQEIQKLNDLNGIVDISKDDVSNYYLCIINTYQQDDLVVMMTRIFFISDDLSIDLYFDYDNYQIYQYTIMAKQKNKILNELDVNHALINYLDISKEDYGNYYTVYQDGYSVEVSINHEELSNSSNQ